MMDILYANLSTGRNKDLNNSPLFYTLDIFLRCLSVHYLSEVFKARLLSL